MPPEFFTTIGLEVHVQLNTRSKIFCGCAVGFGNPPNSSVCPVCLGLPGVLPVLNRQVFRLGLRAVLALGGVPSKVIKFDRKNYFYPDLPKGYQISQYDCPLGRGGGVEISRGGTAKTIGLTRLHLEEDTGKLIHDQSPDGSLVDLNRSGTPLVEIVSEPDLQSPEEAYDFLVALKGILRAIAVSECDMEKGQLRCDANVSLRRRKEDPLGKRVEIKNLNSFRAVRAALQYEVERQAAALARGEVIAQETRLWDETRQKTSAMRSKEEAHDYRYFPEPDLVPFSVTSQEIDEEKSSLPELPRQKKERFMKEYNVSVYDAAQVAEDMDIAVFFEKTVKTNIASPKLVVNWILGPVFAYLRANNTELDRTKLTPEKLARLAALVDHGRVSLQVAKEKIFSEVIEKGSDPETVVKEKGLEQISDAASLERWAEEAIEGNPKVVSDFKSGKESAVMFLVGQVMRKSGGKANPGKVQELIKKKLHAPS